MLRTSRFFPEDDDVPERRDAFDDDNLKVNELLYRRVDIEDVVSAHLCALEKAPALGFGASSSARPRRLTPEDAAELGRDAPRVLEHRVPEFPAIYSARGWKMLPTLDRVYDNERARALAGLAAAVRLSARAARDSASGERLAQPAGAGGRREGYHR